MCFSRQHKSNIKINLGINGFPGEKIFWWKSNSNNIRNSHGLLKVQNCEDPKNFKELGFVIVRSLLSSDEVESLRSFIQDKLALHGNKRFIYSKF